MYCYGVYRDLIMRASRVASKPGGMGQNSGGCIGLCHFQSPVYIIIFADCFCAGLASDSGRRGSSNIVTKCQRAVYGYFLDFHCRRLFKSAGAAIIRLRRVSVATGINALLVVFRRQKPTR